MTTDEPTNGNGHEPETEPPVCGVAIFLMPDGTFGARGLDPESNGLQRGITQPEVVGLCNLVLLQEQMRSIGMRMIEPQKQPNLIVPRGNPIVDFVRGRRRS